MRHCRVQGPLREPEHDAQRDERRDVSVAQVRDHARNGQRQRELDEPHDREHPRGAVAEGDQTAGQHADRVASEEAGVDLGSVREVRLSDEFA